MLPSTSLLHSLGTGDAGKDAASTLILYDQRSSVKCVSFSPWLKYTCNLLCVHVCSQQRNIVKDKEIYGSIKMS